MSTHLSRNLLRGARTSVDIAVLVLAWGAAWALRFDFDVPEAPLSQLALMLPYVVLLQYALLWLTGAHRESWRYASLREARKIAVGLVAAATLLSIVRLVGPSLADAAPRLTRLAAPYSVIAIDLMLATAGLVGVRLARRLQTERRDRGGQRRPDTLRRVLLIGAGRAGVLVSKELEARPEVGMHPIGFLDDDPHKRKTVVAGIPVIGTTADIAEVAGHTGADEAVITMASVDSATIRRIADACDAANLPVKIIPGVYEMLDGRVRLNRIRPVAIEDLLGRAPVELDLTSIHELVGDRVVLVTGAGGSIGSELCRQLARFGPREVVVVDRSENALWAVQRELEAAFPAIAFSPGVGDVGVPDRVRQILEQHRPSVVFHAAAHKHVPMMECNPGEAIRNNVLGTRTLADGCVAHGVPRFVLVSTDKAVNPISVMGATKRLAERYVQHLASVHDLAYVSVRFGNVLGSTGSVVPVFQEQIADGGPVTVTHPDMMRYFMTIPEAAQLVLQAGAMGRGGEIFVLDMGEPVRIIDLAEDLIRLSGYEPHEEIPIAYVGLRPGERLHEQLHLSEEHAHATRHPKIWVGASPDPGWPDVDRDLAELAALVSHPTALVRERLARLVPEMDPDGNGHPSGREPSAPAAPHRHAASEPSGPT